MHHTSSETEKDNKREKVSFLSNLAITPSSSMPPLPSQIQSETSVFCSGLSQDPDLRLPGAQHCTEISQLCKNLQLSQQSSVSIERVSSRGDLPRNGASVNHQLFIGTNGLALLPRYFHFKGT